jgi:hypothetical protein
LKKGGIRQVFHPSLEPDDCSKERKPDIFSVSDVESTQWTGFLLMGHYDKYSDKYRYFFKMDDYFNYIFSEVNTTNIIYFHNGGRFDFEFIYQEVVGSKQYIIDDSIPRGSSILTFKLSRVEETTTQDRRGNWLWTNDYGKEIIIKDKHIISEFDGVCRFKESSVQYRDSLAILPFTLSSMCENFGVKHKKKKMDFEYLNKNQDAVREYFSFYTGCLKKESFKALTKRNFEEIKKFCLEMLEYSEYDCRGLSESIDKYQSNDLIKRSGTAFTTAGQALKVFRTKMDKPIRSLADNIDAFVRPAYFGGRTEIFKPQFWGNKDNVLSYYDVNSLYPSVMLGDFPTNWQYSTQDYFPDKMGFYDALVEVPDDMYIPPLGIMFKVGETEKFIFPSGKFQGRWSTIELEYARSVGVKILWTGQGQIFKNGGPIFKKYIEDLYAIRKASKKNSVDNFIAKNLMNACYGRMGLRRDREAIVFDEGQEGFKLISEFTSNHDDTLLVRIGTVPNNLDTAFSNVAIAAWVTSLARIHMHKIYMKSSNELYYTDTDSLFKTGKGFKESEDLGGLKLEYRCDAACFLLPKTYVFHTLDKVIKALDESGETVMVDLKGVAKGVPTRASRVASMEDWQEAFQGQIALYKMRSKPNGIISFKKQMRKEDFHLLKFYIPGQGIHPFKTSLKKSGSFLTRVEDAVKFIKSMYDKRRIVWNKGAWDTEPLVIRDNEIVNMDEKAKNMPARVARSYAEQEGMRL